MTAEQIAQLGIWLMDNNYAYYTECTNTIYIISSLALDELDCVLCDMGIEYTVEVDDYSLVMGDYLAFINIK